MTRREGPREPKKDLGNRDRYHPHSAPGSIKRNPAQPNVCDECSYHRSHSPTCSKNPEKE